MSMSEKFHTFDFEEVVINTPKNGGAKKSEAELTISTDNFHLL